MAKNSTVVTDDDVAQDPEYELYDLFNIELLKQLNQQPDWLIEDVLSPQGVGIIIGPAGAGKTTLTMEFAMSLSAGLASMSDAQNSIKLSTDTPRGVIYLGSEGGARGFARHAYDFRYRLGDDVAQEAANNFRLVIRTNGRLYPNGNPLLADVIRPLVDDLTQTSDGVGLVVIDHLGRFAGWREANSEVEAIQVIRQVERIRDEHNCAVLLCGHAAKEEQKVEAGIRSTRGSSAIVDCVDSAVALNWRGTKPAERRDSIQNRETEMSSIKQRHGDSTPRRLLKNVVETREFAGRTFTTVHPVVERE